MVDYKFLDKKEYFPFDKSKLNESVFVMFKLKQRQAGYNAPEWHKTQLFNTEEDREFINKLAWENSVDKYMGHIDGYGEVDYIIIDSNGKILLKNFEAEAIQDENKFIHITSNALKLNHLVKSFEAKKNPNMYYFLDGKDFKELKSRVRKAVENNYISTPKNFNHKKGLTKEPIFEIEKSNE